MTTLTVRVPTGKVDGRLARWHEDLVAIEEPLEIRVGFRSLSVTMRTPGHDLELAAGFLLFECIVGTAGQIREITKSGPNIVVVELSPDAVINVSAAHRGFMLPSTCGLSGKEVESLAANRCPMLPPSDLSIDAAVIHQLPYRLRQSQDISERTGGLHAAALFNQQGELKSLREDVGKHNAVDKLIGHALLEFRTPLRDSVMLVSGRASFDLVQKAYMAGVPLLAAVGAPSSLAVAEAEHCGMTLIGFLRGGGFNVYSGSGCIAGLEQIQ
jgi:FdhD protein